MVEHLRSGREGLDHAPVDALLQRILAKEEPVHGPVERVVVAGGVTVAEEEGGGGLVQPRDEPVLARGISESVENHGLDGPLHASLARDPVEGLEGEAVEAELPPQEVPERLATVGPALGDADLADVGEEGR